MNKQYILAIDTSCDDTSAAVTCDTTILSNVVASQTELHKPYGGVFPTVAKLAHSENIDRTIQVALSRAKISMTKIAAIAVTVGPGLAPALEIGISTAKKLAQEYKKPLIAVNHIEGHVISVLAKPAERTKKISTDSPQFPALSIIVSGGHTQFVLLKSLGEYQILGSTLDDAAGECLDKIGRMLNLGYPAGPIIENFAKLGDRNAYSFPLPLTTIKTFDVSFSGMKTYSRNLLQKLTAKKPLSKQEIYDFCASAQYGVFRHICYKLQKVLVDLHQKNAGNTIDLAASEIKDLQNLAIKEIWLGGGVAANMTLRKMIRQTISKYNTQIKKRTDGDPAKTNIQNSEIATFRAPISKRLCADNAAMIGIAAATKLQAGAFNDLESLERVPQLKLQ